MELDNLSRRVELEDQDAYHQDASGSIIMSTSLFNIWIVGTHMENFLLSSWRIQRYFRSVSDTLLTHDADCMDTNSFRKYNYGQNEEHTPESIFIGEAPVYI